MVSEQMNGNLMALAMEEKVQKTLFMMHPEKPLGPDGLTALFFQKAWQVIQKDLVELVNGFFRASSFVQRLNEINIYLIPKKKDQHG